VRACMRACDGGLVVAVCAGVRACWGVRVRLDMIAPWQHPAVLRDVCTLDLRARSSLHTQYIYILGFTYIYILGFTSVARHRDSQGSV
jgi:hypothetical protein